MFPPSIRDMAIVHKEFTAIVIACKLWGHLFPRSQILVDCDNNAVVQVINSGRSKHPYLQQGLRELWFLEAKHDFTLRCQFVPTTDNGIADSLSRWHLCETYQQRFYDLTSSVELEEFIVPDDMFSFSMLI